MTFSGPPRDVVILGSTGSIGRQTLDVVEANCDPRETPAVGALIDSAPAVSVNVADVTPPVVVRVAVAVATPSTAIVTGILMGELLAPARVIARDVAWPNDKDVDVAARVAVAARRRAEDRRVDRGDLPIADLIAQAPLELRADVGQQLDGGRSEMSAVCVPAVSVSVPPALVPE